MIFQRLQINGPEVKSFGEINVTLIAANDLFMHLTVVFCRDGCSLQTAGILIRLIDGSC
jgi:hypothetical protein